MTSRTKKVLMTVAVTVVVIRGVAGAVVWGGLRASDDAATKSCLQSVISGVNALPKDDLNLDTTIGADWTNLSQADSDRLIRAAVAARREEFGCTPHTGIRPTDVWGRPLRIAGRRNIYDKVEFAVWSDGRDGLPGTPDDILIPTGEKVPR